jgi:hypothetical protein
MSEFISGNAGIIRKSDVFCLEIERPSVVDKYEDYRVKAIYYVGEDENLLCRSVTLEIKETFEEIYKSFERIKKEFEEVE